MISETGMDRDAGYRKDLQQILSTQIRRDFYKAEKNIYLTYKS